jgi:hypothetical protein
VERNGERASGATGSGLNVATRTVSVSFSGGEVTAAAGAMVSFFGGLSIFRKLGACVEVASLWPIRARVGTHTNTTTPSRTAARASASVKREDRRVLPKAIALLL